MNGYIPRRVLVHGWMLVFLLCLPLSAQAECNPAQLQDTCTLQEIYVYYFNRDTATATSQAVPNEAVTTRTLDTEEMMQQTAREVMTPNTATPPTDPFAADLHATYQNFLSLLSFGLDEVTESEDGQSLVVRLNPVRRGRSRLGVSVTISKPQISTLVQNAFPEEGRTDAVAALEKTVGDLDDLTYSLAYTRMTKICTLQEVKDGGRCWGRDHEIYRDLLAPTLSEVGVRADFGELKNQRELKRILEDNGVTATRNLVGRTLGDFPDATAKKNAVSALKAWAEEDRERELQNRKLFTASGIQRLAGLIDNQPQLAAVLAYRDPGDFGGPESTTFTLELQYGSTNINSLFDETDGDVIKTLSKLTDEDLSSGKFVFTLSVRELEAFRLAELSLPDGDGGLKPVEDFTAIDTEESTDLNLKMQWGRLLGAEVAGRRARLDFSLEGIWTDAEALREKNRWVAMATYTVPLGDQMSLPISLTYANKPEFLGDPDEQFGTHFGISYRLPGFGDK